MNIFKKFKRDDARSFIKGAPLVLGTNEDGSEAVIYVARAHSSNPEYRAVMDKLTQQNQQELQQLLKSKKDKEHTDRIELLLRQAIRDTCIKGWNNVHDENDMPLLYNQDSVARICAELPELEDKIVEFALNSSNFVGTFDEEESLKN